MKLVLGAAIASAIVMSVPAQAQTFSGTTVGQPTYNRPQSMTRLSGVGTATPYTSTTLTVSASGAYSLGAVSTTPAGWDNVISLYQGSFDPSHALTNLLAYNDDTGGGNFNSLISNQTLTTGVTYIAVVAGFANTNFGAYDLTVSGPGTATFNGAVSAAPEPAAWAFMIIGFGAAGVAMRRSRKKVTVAYA